MRMISSNSKIKIAYFDSGYNENLGGRAILGGKITFFQVRNKYFLFGQLRTIFYVNRRVIFYLLMRILSLQSSSNVNDEFLLRLNLERTIREKKAQEPLELQRQFQKSVVRYWWEN